MNIEPIARIYNDFPSKFGVPRQSGRIAEIEGKIVFEKEYRNNEALRGIEQFSHLWLIWGFSQNRKSEYSPTVRPPRLGGNTRLGVFATRSPYRPNPIGISCVKLERIINDEKNGTVLIVRGADLMNETPIYDIKPYIPYSDCIPTAVGGFAEEHSADCAEAEIPPELLQLIPEDKREILYKVLCEDPRPAYKFDEAREYGFPFADFEIKFIGKGNKIRITDIIKQNNKA